MTRIDLKKTARRLAVAALFAVAALPATHEAQAATITAQGASGSVGNCIPFGCPGSYAPVMGFVYQNIPSFTLNIGDVIAFDTGGVNDVILTFDIHLGATTANGGATLGAGGLTQIVANGTPSSPQGNAVAGDFDLAYTVDSAFTFLGGGLVIALQPTGPLALDTTTQQNLVSSDSTDISNLFVARFYSRTGVPTAGDDLEDDTGRIAHFQILTSETVAEPAALALLGLGLIGIGVATRRRRG